MSQTLSDRLRIARKAADLTARELSKRAGLAEGHVAMIERGTVDDGRVQTIAKIADALGVSLDWLVFGRGEGPRQIEEAA